MQRQSYVIWRHALTFGWPEERPSSMKETQPVSRSASALMILPCSIGGSLSHSITLPPLFVTPFQLPLLLLLLSAHWTRATSCIPGLRFLPLLFYSCPVSTEVAFNGAVGIKNATLVGFIAPLLARLTTRLPRSRGSSAGQIQAALTRHCRRHVQPPSRCGGFGRRQETPRL